MRTVRLISIATTLLLSACGGGGGGSGGAPATPPAEAPFGLTQHPSAVTTNLAADLGSVGAIRLTAVATGFAEPVLLTAIPASGGRHALVEKGGRILILDNAFASESTLLDISAFVLNSGEQGLLGAAFDPDIATNGYFYVHYSSLRSGDRCLTSPYPRCGRVVRYRLNGTSGNWQYGAVDPTSGTLLLEVPQPYENHNGGMLAFGPDAMLYIALGDGGSGGDPQNNGQSRTTLLGKLLRIDPNGATPYAIPPDNPFANATDGSRGEIWAYGLRNPWRFSFDRGSSSEDGGALWLADVGQNAWEEIDRITRGGNYGWNLREGSAPYSGGTGTDLIDPVWQYGRDEGQSVTGGYVYRGTTLSALQGHYLYGDFASGLIWALDSGSGDNQLLLDSGVNISSFGEDAQGELHVVDFSGRLLRIDAASGSAPTAPTTLSTTGLFSSLSPLQPVEGLVAYEVNVPLWSDGTVKRRWFGLPAGADITFDSNGAWQLPPGSVVVKEFSIAADARAPAQLRKLETRVLFHGDNGWTGFTYRWNDAQTEATLVESGASEQLALTRSDGSSFSRRYDYPSSAQCRSCHTRAAGFLLGLRTRQMNRDFAYGTVTDNQLRSYNHVGLFDRDIGAASQYAVAAALDSAASVTQRARDYLDANCAHCHQPGSTTGSSLDLRASTALAAMYALNVTPTAGDLGIADARIIAAGSKERSLLWERMRRDDPAQGRMPPLASHAVDEEAIAVIGSWIDSL